MDNIINSDIIDGISEFAENFQNSETLNNNIINQYVIKNVNFNKKYYYGITVNIYNNYELTKIFLKILNKKVNFDDIIFCFVDDGSKYDIFKLFESLELNNLNYILVQCHRKENIFKLNDDLSGSFYPLIFYIGNEILKNHCNYLGILN